jgi:hypothetical protein
MLQSDDSVKLRSCRARGNEIFRFVESKPFPQLVPEQKEINAHLEDDGANRQIPDFPDLKTGIREMSNAAPRKAPAVSGS